MPIVSEVMETFIYKEILLEIIFNVTVDVVPKTAEFTVKLYCE